MICERVEEHLSALLDNDLDPTTKTEVEEHLRQCPACAETYRDLALLVTTSAALDPLFPTRGLIATPWARFPGLYVARCESAGGATWLQVTKATGAQDLRPVVRQTEGPEWGYHVYDINLALGNLLADVAAAESGWQKTAGKRAG